MTNSPHDIPSNVLRTPGNLLEPPLSPPVIGARPPEPVQTAPDQTAPVQTAPVAPAPAPAPAVTPVSPPADRGRPVTVDELRALPIQALLVRTGALTMDQLSEAVRVNAQFGRSVEDVAVERGWVPADFVAQLTAAKNAAVVDAQPDAPPAPPPAPTEAAVLDAQPDAPPAPPPAPSAPAAPPSPPAEITATPPAAAPEPVPAPQAAADAEPVAVAPSAPPTAEKTVGVFLNLADGTRVWAGRFDTDADAERRAQEVINALVRPDPGVWPRFGTRFVRPEAVVSVELAKRRDE